MSVHLVHEKDVRNENRHVVNALSNEILSLLPTAQIEEIGSTAIPNSLTKGDVDLVVIVKKALFSVAKKKLDVAFESNHMEGIPYFYSYAGTRFGIEFGIQLSIEEEQSFRFVEFRDLLRASPALVDQYNIIKKEASNLSMEEYRAKKNEFIESVLGTKA